MWPFHPGLLQRAVPRYTSYPTAAEFTPAVGAEALVAELETIRPDTPASLYIHIPFCREICWYCGCNTGRTNRAERVEAYLEALHAEIDWLAARLAGRIRVERLSFGGGSPNALEPRAFVQLVDRLSVAFGAARPDISVELDPRTLDPEWADLFRRLGARRASLGVQTLEPDLQQAIGRVQPADRIERAVELLREAGVESLNFDLMFGLPGQTSAHLERTLEAALALGPDRIALFGYAHVPTLIPRQRRIDATALPGLEQRFAQSAIGHRILLGAGYRPVGFDHFARPDDPLAIAAAQGRLRRNFQGFTDDEADHLLGLGASAITSLPGLLVQNEKNVGRYRMRVAAGQAAAERGVRRTAEDRERALVIEDLLCGREADLSGLEQLSESRPWLAPYLEAGLARQAGNLLSITAEGLPYARVIAACFDIYRSHAVTRFSSAL
ncbi:MAG: oxygen-independent coproporphyrinogen III oxidase [Sphingomonadaceae bacterium]